MRGAVNIVHSVASPSVGARQARYVARVQASLVVAHQDRKLCRILCVHGLQTLPARFFQQVAQLPRSFHGTLLGHERHGPDCRGVHARRIHGQKIGVRVRAALRNKGGVRRHALLCATLPELRVARTPELHAQTLAWLRRRLLHGREDDDLVEGRVWRRCMDRCEEGSGRTHQGQGKHRLPRSILCRHARVACSAASSTARRRLGRRRRLVEQLFRNRDHLAEPFQLVRGLFHKHLAQLEVCDFLPAALVRPDERLSGFSHEFHHKGRRRSPIGGASELARDGHFFQRAVEICQGRQLVDNDLVDEPPKPKQVFAAEGRQLVARTALRVHHEVINRKPYLRVQLRQSPFVVSLYPFPLVVLELLDAAVDAVLPDPWRFLHQRHQ
mmetsp:Transcript_78752/g.218871  ORF Transcript_78752/g.218871 Transcript_78752/m.218871 type:complete len:384 (+) Transcript_78752:93-1244(+)